MFIYQELRFLENLKIKIKFTVPHHVNKSASNEIDVTKYNQMHNHYFKRLEAGFKFIVKSCKYYC